MSAAQRFEAILSVRGEVPDVLVQLDFRVDGADDKILGIAVTGEDGAPGLMGYCALDAPSEAAARAELAQILAEESLEDRVSIVAIRIAES